MKREVFLFDLGEAVHFGSFEGIVVQQSRRMAGDDGRKVRVWYEIACRVGTDRAYYEWVKEGALRRGYLSRHGVQRGLVRKRASEGQA